MTQFNALRNTLVVATALTAAVFSSDANATWYLQPSSGHLWGGNSVAIADGMVCTAGTSRTSYWVTPVPATRVGTFYGYTYSGGVNGGTALSRLCGFDANGNYVSGGALTTGSMSAVSVPTDGTVFVQSQLTSTSTSGSKGCVYTVLVW